MEILKCDSILVVFQNLLSIKNLFILHALYIFNTANKFWKTACARARARARVCVCVCVCIFLHNT